MAPQVTLYSLGITPNPRKVMIMLEELNIEYSMIVKNWGNVKDPDFLKINPNGRVPALIDHTNNDFIVWESAAILLYLAERFDTEHKLHGVTLEERTEVLQWLIFQVSGLGPSQGQANWFIHSHSVKQPELHPSVLDRYQDETRRIYGVLEQRLADVGDWIVLGHLTIADIAFFTWLNLSDFAQVDLSAFPKLAAYTARIKALPSVERAYSKTPM